VDKKRILLSIVIGLMVFAWAAVSEVIAEQGTPPQIKVSLALADSRVQGKLIYILDDQNTVTPDHIKMVLTMKNYSGQVITFKGFTGQPFHLFLTFTDPDGKGIVANDLLNAGNHTEPPPPMVIPVEGNLVQVEPVDSIDGGWTLSITIPDAHTYYSLTKAGRYSVKAMIPMRTYSAIDHTDSLETYSELDKLVWGGALESNTVYFSMISDHDRDGYYFPEPYGLHAQVDCDDNNPAVHPGAEDIANGIDDDCDPSTPDGAIPKGTIIVKAEKHTVGAGNYPVTTKAPLVNIPVRIFNMSDTCVSSKGISWQNYESIWSGCNSVQAYCSSVAVPQDRCFTDTTGAVNMIVPPGNYIAISKYEDKTKTPAIVVYAGVSTGSVTANKSVEKYLQIIARADGTLVPGKYIIKTGSQLLIIEPEYIEWDSTQELYPFIFESTGDWGVSTSVTPPQGFITDYKSLSAEVDSAMKAVQFTIRDVGSKWVDTLVEFTVKHSGKTEIVKDKIGVKKKTGK